MLCLMRYLIRRIYSKNSITYVPSEADFTVYDVLRGMLHGAKELKEPVTTVYKGISITVTPNMSWEDAVALWKNISKDYPITDSLEENSFGGDTLVDGYLILGKGNVSTLKL